MYENKNGEIDFSFSNVYPIDYNQLSKKKIKPDFFVHKIEYKKFFEIIESRKYMMKLHYEDKIPENVNYISISGEIKSTYKNAHIEEKQILDYEKFVELVNNSSNDEYIILMYIYDNSFNYFQYDYEYSPEKEIPIIYSYMPKLYYEDCYIGYNDLITELKLNKEKIHLNDNTIFKKKRKTLEKENNDLFEKNNELIEENKKLQELLNNNINENDLIEKNKALIEENKKLHDNYNI